MKAKLIDGNAEARRLKEQLRWAVEVFKAHEGRPPCLAFVLVGNDPASVIYVKNKVRTAESIGMRSNEVRLPANATEQNLLHCISTLNSSDYVDGILLQLPLPVHIRARTIIEAINPAKDVDGLHPVNVGNFYSGGEGIVPCTPFGCMLLIRSVIQDVTGMEAIVIGRSNIVGKPMTYMLSAANATVTLAHSATQDLAAVCRRADLVVCAVGHPEMIRANWIKRGAIVIDVGINRVSLSATTDTKLVGDVAFDEVADVAGAITPVPGGVGPMTIACALRNTVVAAITHNREFEVAVDWILDY